MSDVALVKLVWRAMEDCGVTERDLAIAGGLIWLDILESDDACREDVVWAARKVAEYLSGLYR